jgi:hypothetical protein
MAKLCPFCSFSEDAVKQRQLAKEWDDQGLTCLGTPHMKIAESFEREALAEKVCKCHEPHHGWKVSPLVSL